MVVVTRNVAILVIAREKMRTNASDVTAIAVTIRSWRAQKLYIAAAIVLTNHSLKPLERTQLMISLRFGRGHPRRNQNFKYITVFISCLCDSVWMQMDLRHFKRCCAVCGGCFKKLEGKEEPKKVKNVEKLP